MSSPLDRFLYLVMALAFGGALWLGRDWPPGARIFPLLIGGAGLVLVAAAVLQGILGKRRSRTGDKGPSVVKELATFAWISGYFSAVAVFGFQWGLPAVILVYLKREAELRTVPAFLFAAVCWVFLYTMRAYLYLPLYEGALASLAGF